MSGGQKVFCPQDFSRWLRSYVSHTFKISGSISTFCEWKKRENFW